MAVDLNQYQVVTARELNFHAPHNDYENIAVKTWRDEQKSSSLKGMIFSLGCMILFVTLSRLNEQPLWMTLLFAVLCGILFFWMFIRYRSIMTAQALVACTTVMEANYNISVGTKGARGTRSYYVTVRQDEDKLIADVSVSPAQYQFSGEGRTMYVIKVDGNCYGINSLHAI